MKKTEKKKKKSIYERLKYMWDYGGGVLKQVGAIRMSTGGHSTIDRQASFSYSSAMGETRSPFSLEFPLRSSHSLFRLTTSTLLYFRLALLGSNTRSSSPLYTIYIHVHTYIFTYLPMCVYVYVNM